MDPQELLNKPKPIDGTIPDPATSPQPDPEDERAPFPGEPDRDGNPHEKWTPGIDDVA